MNVLIVGSGAREHAIAKALHRSVHAPTIFCIGHLENPGIKALAKEYRTGDICNVADVLSFAKDKEIKLAIIGPEAPLEKGLADILWEANIPTVGPTKNLAQLETSKAFTRSLMEKYHISGLPRFRNFTSMTGVISFLKELGEDNYVIKADGLMGGKGVKVAGDHLSSIQEALDFCHSLLAKQHTFVIEEKIIGQEFSYMFFCDGTDLIPMPVIQDHKRAFILDRGPNTGGMGSYSAPDHSLPFLNENDLSEAYAINQAVLKAVSQETKQAYQGILYSSFMASKNGVYLIEYNTRFGDPEAMNALALLETDFIDVCQAIVNKTLATTDISFSSLATVCKYVVPEGYPDNPLNGDCIDISLVSDTEHLYLGAVIEESGQLFCTGSRALAYVGVAKTITAAEQIAEQNIQKIKGRIFHRSDIGTAALIEKRIQQMRGLRL